MLPQATQHLAALPPVAPVKGPANAPDATPAGRPQLSHSNQVQLGTVDSNGCFCPKPGAQWTVQNSGDGKANIDLGNYELQLNEHKSQIKIVNKSNGEVTDIWGDPHIDWNGDGKTDANFWGTTTFKLEDGTKITIDTEPDPKHPGETLSNEVTVTRGEHALKITGLSQNVKGDLEIQYADRGGQALDCATPDGFTVTENPCGEGWINPQTGRLATQQDFNQTKLPGAQQPVERVPGGGRGTAGAATGGGNAPTASQTRTAPAAPRAESQAPSSCQCQFTPEFSKLLTLYLLTGIISKLLDVLGQGGGDGDGRTTWLPGHCVNIPPLEGTDAPVCGRRPGRIIQSDPNTVTIQHRDGSVDTRSGGSLAWRLNNPALLPHNRQTHSLGSIGGIDGLATFATEAQGRNALARLSAGRLH